MTTWQAPPAPPSRPDDDTDGMGRAALILGIASFLPIPGVVAGLLALVIGAASGSVDAAGHRRRSRHANTGIALGAVSVGIFLTACFVYFVVLGYPLPNIHRYHPEPDDGFYCGCS